MSPIRSALILVFAAISFIPVSCLKDQATEKYTFFRPVYKTRAEVRAAAQSTAPMTISTPGKIFLLNNFVFLNEVDKGIHIIDISDPAKPVNISFLRIPGCMDMAVRGNYLYADCYTDLVTIDITDPRKAQVKQFIQGVFPHRRYSNGFVSDTSLVITEWEKVDTALVLTNSDIPQMSRDVFWIGSDMRAFSSMASAMKSTTNGIGGSMARFGLKDDRLYTISWSDMKVFNTSVPSLPFYVKTVNFSQGDIETIFPYKDRLFIGSQTGMFIYDITDLDNPKKLGQFTHARACDPVVADDTHAYVTLRSNNRCAGFLNQLDVLDINNLSSPKLLKTYTFTEPAGLGKDGNLLFICDGKDGLKILDASKPTDIKPVKTITGMEAFDVIAWKGIAILTAKDGLHLINYSNPGQAFIAGKITLNQPK
ncbi:MAG: hypothetical protein RL151_708 [Bacteroidota bacterium]